MVKIIDQTKWNKTKKNAEFNETVKINWSWLFRIRAIRKFNSIFWRKKTTKAKKRDKKSIGCIEHEKSLLKCTKTAIATHIFSKSAPSKHHFSYQMVDCFFVQSAKYRFYLQFMRSNINLLLDIRVAPINASGVFWLQFYHLITWVIPIASAHSNNSNIEITGKNPITALHLAH